MCQEEPKRTSDQPHGDNHEPAVPITPNDYPKASQPDITELELPRMERTHFSEIIDDASISQTEDDQ